MRKCGLPLAHTQPCLCNQDLLRSRQSLIGMQPRSALQTITDRSILPPISWGVVSPHHEKKVTLSPISGGLDRSPFAGSLASRSPDNH